MKEYRDWAIQLGFPDMRGSSVGSTSRRPVEPQNFVRRLGSLKLSRWETLAKELVNDRNVEVRKALAISLGQTEDESAAAFLSCLASDRSWKVRESVAISIKNLGYLSLLPIVLQLLSDENLRVCAAARRALMKFQAVSPGTVGGLLIGSTRMSVGNLDRDYWRTLLEQFPSGDGMGAVHLETGPGFPAENMELADLLIKIHNVDLKPQVSTTETTVSASSRKVRRTKTNRVAYDSMKDPAMPESKRYVNSWFRGHPNPSIPLATDKEYALDIQIDPRHRLGNRTSGDEEFHEPASGNEALLDVVVGLSSDDFDILDPSIQRIKLPRDPSRSSEVATFQVIPRKNHTNVSLNVFFYHRNNLFHEAKICAFSERTENAPSSHQTAYASNLNMYRGPLDGQGSDLSLQVVKPMGEEYYRLVLFYDFGQDNCQLLSCHLCLTQDRIEDIVHFVREDLRSLVEPSEDSDYMAFIRHGENKARAIREGRIPKLDLPSDATLDQALQHLARLGCTLFGKLFEISGDVSEKDQNKIIRMRKILGDLSRGRRLKIQILSDTFFIPWNLLYDGPFPSGAIVADEFWGFKHVIEEVTYRLKRPIRDMEIIVGNDKLSVGMNINRVNIPLELSDPQVESVRRRKDSINLFVRSTEQELQETLADADGPCPIEYFFCHAGESVESQGDIDKAYLGITQPNTGLTLGIIKLWCCNTLFHNRPLFILNACESGMIDGRFYDGFVPQFIHMGACCVVGSDNKIPSLYGAHFGLELMKALFQGKPIGEALRDTRRFMLQQYKNPLGLVYRVFGDADVRLSQPVP
jgi:hypothetical protein